MFEKLIFALAGFTLLFFIIYMIYKGNTVKASLLFVLAGLPLMNLKITPEWLGGFKTFDFVCFYGLVFLLKDLTTINLKKNQNLYLLLFIGIVITLVLSGLSSEFPERTWISFFRFIPIFIFGRFLLITCSKDPNFYKEVILALKVSYGFALLFLFAQVVFGLGFTFYPTLGPNTVDTALQLVRFPGIFYDSQAHGQYLALGSFLFLYIEEGSTKKVKILNYSIFVLAIIGMVLAGSRAPIGGFLVGIFLIFLLLAGKYRIYGLAVSVIAIAAYTAIMPESGIFKRTASLSDDFRFRTTLWDEALTIWTQHPIMGIGVSNYQDYVMRHHQNQYLEIEEGIFLYFDQPENGYLKILVELGALGLFFVAIMLLYPLLKGSIGYLKKTYNHRIVFLMASLISWMVAFNTVYSIYDYRIMILIATMVIVIISYPINNHDEASSA